MPKPINNIIFLRITTIGRSPWNRIIEVFITTLKNSGIFVITGPMIIPGKNCIYPKSPINNTKLWYWHWKKSSRIGLSLKKSISLCFINYTQAGCSLKPIISSEGSISKAVVSYNSWMNICINSKINNHFSFGNIKLSIESKREHHCYHKC